MMHIMVLKEITNWFGLLAQRSSGSDGHCVVMVCIYL